VQEEHQRPASRNGDRDPRRRADENGFH
jgi:hypothetical protein